jgi:hypothetical protein
MVSNEKRVYEVTYIGKGVSLNDFYSQGKFYFRNKIKKEYTELFNGLIQEAGVQPIEKYILTCYFNSRFDTSNVSGMIKMFEDTLAGVHNRRKGYGVYEYPRLIPDDSSKYCMGIEIYPDFNLEKNTYKFIIKEQ